MFEFSAIVAFFACIFSEQVSVAANQPTLENHSLFTYLHIGIRLELTTSSTSSTESLLRRSREKISWLFPVGWDWRTFSTGRRCEGRRKPQRKKQQTRGGRRPLAKLSD